MRSNLRVASSTMNGVLYDLCFPLMTNWQLSSVSPVMDGLIGTPDGKLWDPLGVFSYILSIVSVLLPESFCSFFGYIYRLKR